MNYVILGLPGTGKTTICKNIAENSILSYVNDYQILKENGITFDNNVDILNKDYSSYILSFLKDKDNMIVDLQYTLKPSQIKQINAIAYYLGFSNIEPETLIRLLNKKDNIFTLDTAQIFVEKSREMRSLCEKNNIAYFEIGKDRDGIINKIICNIMKIKKS